MDSKELRVGSYVELVSNNPVKLPCAVYLEVGNVGFDYIVTYFPDHPKRIQQGYFRKPKDLIGIEITKDILDRCNFKKNGERYFFDKIVVSLGADHAKVFLGNFFLVDVFYLHELQNVVQCILKKNLTIKL